MRTKGNLWGSTFSFHLFVTSRDWTQGLCMLSYLVSRLPYILYFLLLASFLYLLILMAVFSQGPFALICIHLQKGVPSSTRTPELPSSRAVLLFPLLGSSPQAHFGRDRKPQVVRGVGEAGGKPKDCPTARADVFWKRVKQHASFVFSGDALRGCHPILSQGRERE